MHSIPLEIKYKNDDDFGTGGGEKKSLLLTRPTQHDHISVA